MTEKAYRKSLSSSVVVMFLLALLTISFSVPLPAQTRMAGRSGSQSFGRFSSQRSFSGYEGGYRSSGGEHAFSGFSNQRSPSVIHSQPRVMSQGSERSFTNQRSYTRVSPQTSNRNWVNERAQSGIATQRNFTAATPRVTKRSSVNEHASNGIINQNTGTDPRTGINTDQSRKSNSSGVINNRVPEGNRAELRGDRTGGFDRGGTYDRNRGFRTDHRGVFDRDHGFSFHHGHHYPIGSVFWSVPFGAEAFFFGGLTYFWWNDIWYCGLGDRYVVVDSPYDTTVVDQEPVFAPSGVEDGEQMAITQDLVNVRSGPGPDYPVVYVLHQGDVVTVHGYDSDWVYISNSNDESGWIMSEDASPITDSTNE